MIVITITLCVIFLGCIYNTLLLLNLSWQIKNLKIDYEFLKAEFKIEHHSK